MLKDKTNPIANRLIPLILDGDKNALSDLWEEAQKCVYYVIKHNLHKFDYKYTFNEYIGDCYIRLYRLVYEKGMALCDNFTSYMILAFEFELKNQIKKRTRKYLQRVVCDSETLYNDRAEEFSMKDSGFRTVDNLDELEYYRGELRLAFEELSNVSKFVLNNYHGLNGPDPVDYKTVAKMYGTTPDTVIQLNLQALKKLKKKLDELDKPIYWRALYSIKDNMEFKHSYEWAATMARNGVHAESKYSYKSNYRLVCYYEDNTPIYKMRQYDKRGNCLYQRDVTDEEFRERKWRLWTDCGEITWNNVMNGKFNI